VLFLTSNHNVQVIQHGACLGLGLASLGTADEEVYEDIKNVLYTDSAVAGEAAGIGMGLLMVGTASEKASEMLAYAHDTQHEKIIRLVLFKYCCPISEGASSPCSDISLCVGVWHLALH
jgi:hypothetical protein